MPAPALAPFCLRRTPLFLAVAAALGLSACETTGGLTHREVGEAGVAAAAQPDTNLYSRIPQDKLTSVSRQLAAEGMKALDERRYEKASDLFNLAVKTDITNSYLHFLNGVAYQMRGINGESAVLPLAEQGYEMAIQFDSGNWLARYYGGLLAMQQRNFAKAQKMFVEATLYAGNQAELLYDLAVASYYNRDPKTAAAALEGLRALQEGKADDPRTLRASAIIAAALDQKEETESFLDRLRRSAIGSDEVAQVEDRVKAWRNAHARSGAVQPTIGGAMVAEGFIQTQAQGGFPTTPSGYPSAPSGFLAPPSGFPAAPGGAYPVPSGAGYPPGRGYLSGQPGYPGLGMRSEFVEKQMAVVDVVILSTEEDNNNSMGVNLLDGLRLQFGNPITSTPGWSRTSGSAKTADLLGGTQTSTNNDTITRLIQMPAITYNLNIANSNARRNEVLARPTLVAVGNQTSTFFSGVDVNAAAISNGQGAAVQIQKEVGVKLAVTPEFLPDGLIKLNVIAERTFLTNPSKNVVFDFRLDTTKTQVNANVVMKFGETLILSGLSEREQAKDRDGVPFLQELPVVQYFFSRAVTREYYKSVLILLTPRRAQYTQRSEGAIAAERQKMTPDELALEEFADKYRAWFKPAPNAAEVIRHLESGVYFREFQTGDLGLAWHPMGNHGERLAGAIKFLFY